MNEPIQPETSRIVSTLKRLMRARSVTYSRLALHIGISEASVKRIFANATFTLSRLEQICTALDSSIQEVTRLAGEHSTESRETLSIDQEKALASDPNLLACYYLTANGRSGREIGAELGVDDGKVRRWYAQLQALGMVELKPGLRARARTSSAVQWRQNGPVSQLYARQVRQEFLQASFLGTTEALHFRSAELSDASRKVLLRKLERLADEFRDLADLDRSLPSRDKRSMGLLAATRPWVFSMFASLRQPEFAAKSGARQPEVPPRQRALAHAPAGKRHPR